MVNSYKENIIKDLTKLLEISSVSHDFKGLGKVSKEIVKLTKGLPLTWDKIEKKDAHPFLVGRAKVNDSELPKIIFSGHMDTVLPSRKVEVKGGRVYGSGAMDMKGGIIVIIEVLRKLRKLNLCKNVIVALSPEEEIATPNHNKTIQKIAKEGDIIFVFESTLDTIESPSKKSRSIIKTRKGAYTYEIEIKSEGGHAGTLNKKHLRHNTLIEASKLVLSIEEEITNYKKETTLNVGICNSGIAVNVISPRTFLIGDCRFKTVEEEDRTRQSLQKLVNEINSQKSFTASLKFTGGFPPLYETDANEKLITGVLDVAGSMGLQVYLEEKPSPSEANWFQFSNPKAAVIDGMGVYGKGEHTENEYVEIKSVFDSIDFSVELIKNLLR